MSLYGAGGIAGQFAKAKARAAWANARAKTQVKDGVDMYKRMVLQELSIDEAVDRIALVAADKEMDHHSPLQLLGTALVKERVKKHLGILFIENFGTDVEDFDNDKVEKEDTDRQHTVEAAKELGGRVGELGRTLERVWKLGRNCMIEVRDAYDDEPGVDSEIQALLTALVLSRRVTSTSSALKTGVSNTFSRSLQKDQAILRRVLGSRVFEEWDRLEDARDWAVDLVVELERKSVGLD